MSDQESPEATTKVTCFVIMPITAREEHLGLYGGDSDHWLHVQESLFRPALEALGYEPIFPKMDGGEIIHAEIIQNLAHADLVLCDLSTLNANVLWELGVRCAFNLPVAVVVDELVNPDHIPFDISHLNRETYRSTLTGWEIESQRVLVGEHIRKCVEKADGHNQLWRVFGIDRTAKLKTDLGPEEGFSILLDRLDGIERRLDRPALSSADLVDIGMPTTRSQGLRIQPQSKQRDSMIDQALLAMSQPLPGEDHPRQSDVYNLCQRVYHDNLSRVGIADGIVRILLVSPSNGEQRDRVSQSILEMLPEVQEIRESSLGGLQVVIPRGSIRSTPTDDPESP